MSAETLLTRELQRERARVAVARRWLEGIRDHKPTEVAKDEFAYDRMVASYREAAAKALKEMAGARS